MIKGLSSFSLNLRQTSKSFCESDEEMSRHHKKERSSSTRDQNVTPVNAATANPANSHVRTRAHTMQIPTGESNRIRHGFTPAKMTDSTTEVSAPIAIKTNGNRQRSRTTVSGSSDSSRGSYGYGSSWKSFHGSSFSGSPSQQNSVWEQAYAFGCRWFCNLSLVMVSDVSCLRDMWPYLDCVALTGTSTATEFRRLRVGNTLNVTSNQQYLNTDNSLARYASYILPHAQVIGSSYLLRHMRVIGSSYLISQDIWYPRDWIAVRNVIEETQQQCRLKCYY